MANRIFFQPNVTDDKLYEEHLIEFEWIPGIAKSQSIKCIEKLHEAITEKIGLEKILEISTKSNEVLGMQLSAFNLPIKHDGIQVSVESFYQASKIFEHGGPFPDLLSSTSLNSKKDIRLKTHGELIGYMYGGINWPIKPSPNFYDYLYISALLDFPDRNQLQRYAGFTDIAYSQTSLKLSNQRSFNCQARSAAIYVSLLNRMDENQMLDFLFKKCTEKFTKRNQYFQELLD
jgi:hypothetical protein